MSLTDVAQPVLSRTRIANTIGYYAAFIGLGLYIGAMGPTLPGLAEHVGADLGRISFLFVARSLGYLLGAVLGGQLYDRLPGHVVIASVLAAMGVMLYLTPLVPMLLLLAAVLLILGIGDGMLDVGANTLLVWTHRRAVGPFMNALHFFFGVGAFIAPIVVARVALITGDITWAYWIFALWAVPAAAWIIRLPSPAPERTTDAQAKGQTNWLFVGVIALFFFTFVGAELGFGGWIYTYALKMQVADTARAAYLTSAFWGALTVGRLLAVPISMRVEPRPMLLVDLIGCAGSIALVLLWPHSQMVAWVGALGMGLFMASMFPTTLNFAERIMTITSTVTSAFLIGASVGSMVLPWIIGQLFEPFGPKMVMVVILADLALSLCIFGALLFISARQGAPSESS